MLRRQNPLCVGEKPTASATHFEQDQCSPQRKYAKISTTANKKYDDLLASVQALYSKPYPNINLGAQLNFIFHILS